MIQSFAQAQCLSQEEFVTIKCFEVLIRNLLILSSTLVVIILFVMFVFGSMKYLISGGDPEKIKEARATFQYALVGLLLFICSFLILRTIDVLFLGGKGKILTFTIDDTVPTRGPVQVPQRDEFDLHCKNYCTQVMRSRGKNYSDGYCAAPHDTGRTSTCQPVGVFVYEDPTPNSYDDWCKRATDPPQPPNIPPDDYKEGPCCCLPE